MKFDFKMAVERLFWERIFWDGPITFALLACAAVLLTRPTRQARTLGAAYVGLLVYGVLWMTVAEVLVNLLIGSSAGGTPTEDYETIRIVWVGWQLVGGLGDAAAVLVVAWAVAKRPRPRSSEPAGES